MRTDSNKDRERRKIARQVARFPTPYTDRLADCAAISDRVAQLASSHPVLFFALATRYGKLSARRKAVSRAADGRPLREVCDALGIPLCFKRIPPESCSEKLSAVRWSAAANRLLAPHVPNDAKTAAAWLPLVCFAHHACDERFAIWVARQELLFRHRKLKASTLLPLAVFAWYSQSDALANDTPTVPPWSPDLNLQNAIKRAALWLDYWTLIADLGPEGLVDGWIEAGTANGFCFAPLLTPDALIEEAQAMRNCVASYGKRLAHDQCRLFSVTRRERRIATLSIQRFAGSFSVADIAGPANRSCPAEVRRAAYAWVQTHATGSVNTRSLAAPSAHDYWLQQLLAPYACSTTHGRTRVGHSISFATLRARLWEIASRAGVELPAFRGM